MTQLYAQTTTVKTVTELYLVTAEFDESTYIFKIFISLSEARAYARRKSNISQNMWFYIDKQDLRNSSSTLKRMENETYYQGKRYLSSGRSIAW